jgi:predicted AlkP superfamily pyrophosphatase or phosphodiesterase
MRRFASVVFAITVLAPALGSGGTAPPAVRAKPRLAVILAVDGLSWDRLSALRPWLTSGLKRLLDDGAVLTGCRYGHLNTETGPGHASIATGAPPRVHGIALNQWYAPSADGKGMEAIYSASQPLPGEPENSSKTILGPGRLRVATLGDRLVARDPRSKVVAISNKDRAAILLAGRDRRHAAYWYSSKDGTYVTSAAYDAASPAGAAAAKIVARFNQEKAGAKLATRSDIVWSRLPVPDPAPPASFESGLDAYQDQIVGPSFPHDPSKSKRPLPSALLWTPFADGLLTDLALELLADDELALGRGDVPDILAVSFSANDYVSHYYGPESLEELEELRALDRDIGRLLDDLTARFGAGSALVALSADHGFLPLPEATKRRDPGTPGGRVADVKILDQLNAAVNAALKRTGAPPLVYRYEGCSLWLDRVALAQPGAPDPKRVLDIVRHELATTWKGVIERTFVVDTGISSGSRNELVRRAWNARVPGRSGDLFVVPRYGVLIDPYGGTGSSHGTPWEYDTHVPLLFWGGGVVPRTLSAPATPYDLAPTLASWLGIELPDATGNRLDVWGQVPVPVP